MGPSKPIELVANASAAEAIRTYARASGASLESQNAAAEIAKTAERRAGALLKERVLHRGDRGNQYAGGKVAAYNLADLGIEKTQSHRRQRMAAIPEDVFRGYIEATKKAGREITTAGVLRRRGNVTPCQLRHTFAETSSAVVDRDELAAPLGHKSIRTTGFYFEVRDKRALQAAKSIKLGLSKQQTG